MLQTWSLFPCMHPQQLALKLGVRRYLSQVSTPVYRHRLVLSRCAATLSLPQRISRKSDKKTCSFSEFSASAQRRGYTAWGERKEEYKQSPEKDKLKQLFNPFSQSPLSSMRRRAAYIKQHSYCPHPDHRPVRMNLNQDPDTQLEPGNLPAAHVDFECPDCGIPVYCSKEHWQDDYEAHLEVCDTLRQINEDDHDLRSGRVFPEFEYADLGMDEAAVNMTSWDTFMYTRNFRAINDDRGMRHATRLLTYPITIGSVIHELSPYNLRNRVTAEGLKSMAALRYTLHPPMAGQGTQISQLRPEAPFVRIFVLGARAESSLPRDVWVQLAYLFPRARIHLILIGPEAMANRDDEFPLPQRTPRNPFGAIVEDKFWHSLKITTIVEYYQTLHEAQYFQPFDPYFDCFMLFHPGLGHPASSHEWEPALPLLLETKCPVICTGYTHYDMVRDLRWLRSTSRGEFDLLLEPGENTFRSLRWDLNDMDPQDISCGNWGVWAFRGKRYETTRREVV